MSVVQKKKLLNQTQQQKKKKNQLTLFNIHTSSEPTNCILNKKINK